MLSFKTKVLLILIGIFLSFTPPVDPDFGWHYKLGEYIVQTKTVPEANLFSYTYPDYKWTNSYWLSQVIMYGIYSPLGSLGGSLAVSFLFSSAILIIIDKFSLSRTNKVGVFSILIGIVSSVSLVTVRPVMFSTIMMLLLLKMLLEPKWLFLTPLLFVVWANLHADFVIGLTAFFGYAVYQVIKKKIKLLPIIEQNPLTVVTNKISINKIEDKETPTHQLVLFLILSFTATLITPAGTELWKTLLVEANPVQFKIIGEWVPFYSDNSSLKDSSFHFVILLFSGVCLASIILTYTKYPLWLSVLGIAFFILSIRSKYFFRLLCLVSIFQVVGLWTYIFTTANSFFKEIKFVRLFVVILTSLVVLFHFILSIATAYNVKTWSEKYNYPYNAVQKVKELKPKGNMFNHYDWGGYLIYQLPEYKTFIDGRMASWNTNGEYILETFNNLEIAPEKNKAKWNGISKDNKIGFMLEKRGSKLVKYLNETNEWKEVYSDETSVLLLNKALNP